MSTPESKVKLAIKKVLQEQGVWLAGTKRPTEVKGWMYMPVPMGFGVNGIPDFCGIYLGAPLYIEAKAPGTGVLSENQKKRGEEIVAAGGDWVVVSDAAQVAATLKDICDRKQKAPKTDPRG